MINQEYYKLKYDMLAHIYLRNDLDQILANSLELLLEFKTRVPDSFAFRLFETIRKYRNYKNGNLL